MGLASRQVRPQGEPYGNWPYQAGAPTPSAHLRKVLLSGAYRHAHTPGHLASQQKIHDISLEISRPVFKFAWKDAWPQAVLHWDGMGEREGQLVHSQDLHLSLSWSLVALSTLHNTCHFWAARAIPPPPPLQPLLGTIRLRVLFAPVHSPFSENWLILLTCQWPLHTFFLLSWVYYLYFILLLLLSWSIRKKRRGIFVFSV